MSQLQKAFLVPRIINANLICQMTHQWHNTVSSVLGECTDEHCSPHIFARYDRSEGRFLPGCGHFSYTWPVDAPFPGWPMLHVSYRNRLTWRILRLIERHRKQWLTVAHSLDLMPWSARVVIDDYQQQWGGESNPVRLEPFVMSRVINHTHVEVHGQRILMNKLFPEKMEWIGRLIQSILVDHPYATDRELREEIARYKGYDYTTRYICSCRKRAGILPAREREGKSIRTLCWGAPFWQMMFADRLRTARAVMRLVGRWLYSILMALVRSSILEQVRRYVLDSMSTLLGAHIPRCCGRRFLRMMELQFGSLMQPSSAC